MMMPWRYRLDFEAGPGYLSPDVRQTDPGWSTEQFRGKITGMQFGLPTGHRIRMSGFERYNFFIEASQPMGGGSCRIDAVWLCGAVGKTVEMYRIGAGRVVRMRRPDGREWGGGPTRGWKPGLAGKIISAVTAG